MVFLERRIGRASAALAMLAAASGAMAEEIKPRQLVGQWRCNSFLEGKPVSENVVYTVNTFQSSMLLQGQSIVLDGSYTAQPSGENGLSVTYQPFNWRPRLICTGPGGVGSNCAPLTFALRTDQLFFPRPDIYQVRQGVQLVACYKLK